MNMFLHELKVYRKSAIIWSASLAVLIFLFLSLYPSFANSAADVKSLLKGYPESVRKAFGISIGEITKFISFYSFVFTYVMLCGAIQAMNLGISIISKEVRGKTADFLMSKPVTRTQIMTSKILAALTLIVFTNIVYLIVAYIMASAVTSKAFSMKIFFMISITLFFIQLIFLPLGVFISVVAQKIKSSISVSLSTVFAFYAIGMLQSTISDKSIKYITPFKYFDPGYIIKNASYETPFVIITIIIIVALIVASYGIYSKKDVYAV